MAAPTRRVRFNSTEGLIMRTLQRLDEQQDHAQTYLGLCQHHDARLAEACNLPLESVRRHFPRLLTRGLIAECGGAHVIALTDAGRRAIDVVCVAAPLGPRSRLSPLAGRTAFA